MPRRKRRAPEHGEFKDPLKDYAPRDYEDPMEQALVESRVRDMKIEPFTALSAETTIEQTLERMSELNIACVLIVDNDCLCGIFSERDVLYRVADRFEQIKDRPVREVMTPRPSVVYRMENPAKALNLMADHGFRHVPILNVDDKVVGILGPRRVTTFLRKYFND